MATQIATSPIVEGLGNELWRKGRWLHDDIVVDFEPDLSQPTIDHAFELPFMRLHCARHPHCQAEETASVEKGEQIDASLAIVGINAEAITVSKVKIEPGWSTEDGKCLQILVPATIHLTFGHTRVNGQRKAYGLRLAVAELPTGTREQTEIPVPHGCDMTLDSIAQDRWVMPSPLRVSAGESSMALKVATEVTGRLGVGLKLFEQQVDLGMTYSRTVSKELARSYKLTSGATYLAYAGDGFPRRPELAPEVFWTTSVS